MKVLRDGIGLLRAQRVRVREFTARGFPRVPKGWYYVGCSRALQAGPVGFALGGVRYVAFLGGDGRPAVLEARCCHMGADLSRGCVVDGAIHCPLHGWQYAGDGQCVKIPASADIPPFVRQRSYPTDEVGGHVVFHNGPADRAAMPFFDGVRPGQLLAAPPFELVVNTPWYMIGANAFDLQHFRIAHDRTLIDEPVVDSPAPQARRIVASYRVSGSSFRDRLTRIFSGPTVRMSITVHSGTLILVTATFARTTSYGMVLVRPLGPTRTRLRNIAWVPRRVGALARALIDPLDARVRRSFIRAFMMDDASRSDGVRYNPGTLIEADRVLREYMDWLVQLSGSTEQHIQRDR